MNYLKELANSLFLLVLFELTKTKTLGSGVFYLAKKKQLKLSCRREYEKLSFKYL